MPAVTAPHGKKSVCVFGVVLGQAEHIYVDVVFVIEFVEEKI